MPIASVVSGKFKKNKNVVENLTNATKANAEKKTWGNWLKGRIEEIKTGKKCRKVKVYRAKKYEGTPIYEVAKIVLIPVTIALIIIVWVVVYQWLTYGFQSFFIHA